MWISSRTETNDVKTKVTDQRLDSPKERKKEKTRKKPTRGSRVYDT